LEEKAKMAARKRSEPAEAGASGPGLPAKRLLGRSIVVVLGSDELGLSILARTLHALGVDMLEGEAADLWSGDGDDWSRPWVGELNGRLLQVLGREPGKPTHALPFPAGWWRRPAVQKVRREICEALDGALEGRNELWGFADLATGRLLPVWQDVFDELGLNPIYLWALADPVRAAAKGKGPRAASLAEVAWFTCNADIFKYAGDRVGAVIDEAEWRADPQGLMERLVGTLQLRWRGTRFDLYETVSAVLARHEDEPDRPQRVAPSLPLAQVLHRAVLAMHDDPEARERAAGLVESAELLRPLIAPFLPALENGSAQARPQREPAAQRAAAPPQASGPRAAAEAGDERIHALQLEVEARVAEARWLRDQYRERLREAEGEAEALRQRLAEAETTARGRRPSDDDELAAAHAEIQRLQSEMVNLSNANERYLARIYELKKALEDRGDFEPFGS
jgi:hypothetical protein